MQDRTATRALTAAIASYLYGFATLIGSILIDGPARSKDWHGHLEYKSFWEFAYILAVAVTLLLNTMAIVLGKSALRAGSTRTRATLAVWLGVVGYVGSAALFLFFMASLLSTA